MTDDRTFPEPTAPLIQPASAPEPSHDSVQMTGLDVYEGGFTLHWSMPTGKNVHDHAEEVGLHAEGASVALTLRDGLGTPYRQVHVRTTRTQGATSYQPAIPEDASLEVFTKAGIVRFETPTATRPSGRR
jgi:hypothetical protein